jgi:hypothetical protein
MALRGSLFWEDLKGEKENAGFSEDSSYNFGRRLFFSYGGI